MTKVFLIKNYDKLDECIKTNILENISNLHFKNLPKSFYTISGINIVKFYYELLLLNKEINLCIAKEENSDISGFVIWAPSKLSFKILLFRNLFRIKFKTLLSLFKLIKFDTCKRLLYKFRNSSFKNNLPNNSVTIISIVVDQDNQGKGIGTKLIDLVLDESKKNKYDFLIATTTSLQKDAINFYNSLINFELIYKNKISSSYVEYTFSKNLK